MEDDTTSATQCLNCGTAVKGAFCHQCGQQARDNSDRSLGRILSEFLANIFFLDNRFLLSAWFLIRYPSRMTVEFLEGKRKKFVSPVTLFLFLNLIYFFVSPLSDYSLSLYDQMNSQPYSDWIKKRVELKIEQKELDPGTYASSYQNASDQVSKSIMIINVPMIAAFVYLMAFKRRRFYFDHLIFAFHFFTLFMMSWVILDWVDQLLLWVTGNEDSIASAISFYSFAFFVPLIYGILGVKQFLNLKWYWALPAGLVVSLAVTLANFIYRFIVFWPTFWIT